MLFDILREQDLKWHFQVADPNNEDHLDLSLLLVGEGPFLEPAQLKFRSVMAKILEIIRR
jgi:hypothetical protein